MKKKFVEVDWLKSHATGIIPETEEGVKFIQDLTDATVELDDEPEQNTTNLDEAIKAERAKWDAENAKAWIKAFGTPVTPEQNSKAVEQKAIEAQVSETNMPPTYEEYTKEGVMNNALYT